MIRGKFLAQDDIDVAGHRILNWKWLDDLPTDGAADGQVLVYSSGSVTWATISASGVVSVDWPDIQNKPTEFPPEAHTQDWGTITGKPTFVNSVTGGLGIGVSATTGSAVEISNTIQADQTEPTGFVGTPGTYTSTIAVTDNRTFSIGPAAGETEFSFYIKGTKYTRTSTESVTFPDVEGVYAAYYNENGTLSATATPLPGSIFTENAIVAVWRWDTSEQEVIYFGEERHGIVMDGKTHQYLHDTEGTRMIGGHALADINADDDGDLDSSATLSVEAGTIADEDLFLSAAATTNATQVWYVFSKTDTGDWQRHGPTNFPVRYTANNTPTYNLFSGGTWSQSIIGNLDYVLAHIYRSNSTTAPYIVIQGEAEYGNLAAAREGAADEINDIFQNGLPFVEFHPLGTLIFEHRTSYANTPRARIRVTDTGDDYVDWRFQQLTPGAGPGDHGSLAGLGDKDHPTTALQQTGATTNQLLEWDGTDWQPTGSLDVDGIAVNSGADNLALQLESTDANVQIRMTDSGGYCNLTQASGSLFIQPSNSAAFGIFNSGNCRAYGNLTVDDDLSVGGYVTADKELHDRLRSVRTSDKTCTSTTAVTCGLDTTIDVNAYYRFYALLRIQGTTALSPNLEISVTKPSGSVCYLTSNITASGTEPTTTKVALNVNGTTDLMHTVEGHVYTGATSGTFALNMGLAGAGGNVDLLRASCLDLVRLDEP